MSYEVLARKWRPQKFSDVVGQGHITRTLQNAMSRDRIGHAYLFVGPRGTGKTTSARIFAKALNCETPITDTEGHVEPCCECRTCKEIAAGSCLDVLEIDGASNNKVDDIRDLRDTVQYSPSSGRQYKVYIIDEVHMLTPGAWNALLKTLEEPPSHVKFLFATTEAHKVLPTILSRCQRFDLKPIAVAVIIGRLRQIADAEGIHIHDAALTVIARAADGGMRDAQSIFDQMIAFCAGDSEATAIGESDVVEVFGLASQTELRALAGALITNDAQASILALHHLAEKGRNLERVYQDILLTLRAIMICQIVADPGPVLGLAESEIVEIRNLAKDMPPAAVRRLVEGMMAHDGRLRNTLNKRVFLESILLRVMREAHTVTIDDLLSRLQAARERGDLSALDIDAPAVTQKKTIDVTPAAPVAESAISAAPVPPPAAPVPPAAAPVPPPAAPVPPPAAPVPPAAAPVPPPAAPVPPPAAPVPPPAAPVPPPAAPVPPAAAPVPPPAAPVPPPAAPVPPPAAPVPPAAAPAPPPAAPAPPPAAPVPPPAAPAPPPAAPVPPPAAPVPPPAAPAPPPFPPPVAESAPSAPPAAAPEAPSSGPEQLSDFEKQFAAAAKPAESNVPAKKKPRSKVQTATTEEWKRIEKLPFVQSVCEQFDGRVVDVRPADS